MSIYEDITGEKYVEPKKGKNYKLPDWVSNQSKKKKKNKIVKKSSYLEDGYDFGDVTKTILSTTGDLAANVGKGFMSTIEGTVDTARYAIGNATKNSAELQAKVWDFLGNEAYANQLRKAGQDVKDYTYKNAQMNVTGALLGETNDLFQTNWSQKLNEGSAAGSLVNSVEQGIGNIGAFVGLSGIGGLAAKGAGALGAGTTTSNALTSLTSSNASTFVNSFTSAFGNSMSNALNSGLDEKEAKGQAITSGLAEAISEQFFQGIPGLKSAGWADNLISKPIGKYFSGKTGKIALKVMDSVGEGLEEVISNVLQTTFEGIRTNKNVKDIFGELGDTIKSEETREAMISAFISSALTNGGGALITNNQKNQIIESYAQEHDMSVKETKQLFDSLVEKKANLEETSNYKERVDLEENISKQLVKDLKTDNKIDLNELFKQTPNSLKEMQFRFNQEEAKNVRTEKQNILANDMARLNDEKSNHELYKVVNAIQSANDTQQYHITTTEGLYEMGIVKKNSKGEYVMPDGSPYVPRGLNYKNGEIYINADVGSQSGTQAVYHEMFEGFKKAAPEQYNEFKQMVTDIIGEKNIQKEFDTYKAMYGEELTDDIRNEIINDKFGELAENQNFINKIADNRNVLEKFIDSIKNMIKYVKGTDEERQLMKLQKNLEKEFAKRYKETDFSQGKGDTAYSLKEQVENQAEKAMKQDIANYNSIRETILDYVADNNLKNPSVDEMLNAMDDYNMLDYADYDLQDYKQAQKLFKEVAQDIYNENNTKYSLNDYEAYQNEINETLNKAKNISEDFYNNMKNQLDEYKERHPLEYNIYEQTKSRPATNENYNSDFFKEHSSDYDGKSGTNTADGRLTVLHLQKGDNLAKLSFTENQDKIWIDELYVKNQKQGYGSEIVNAIKDYANRTGKYVEAFKELQTAKGFWDKTLRSDTRYSLATNKDNTGRTLTKEQRDFFRNSKVVDDEGNLKVVYRGSSTEKSYNVFDTDRAGSNGIWFGKGFYFAGELDHALTYAKNNDTSNIYEVYLNLTNPYIMDSDTTNPDGTIEFAPGFYEQIENKFGDYLPTDWKELNSYQKGRAAQNALMDNGYDGVIAGDTYVAYNSNQIKNVDNTNPTSNEDIRYSLAPTGETSIEDKINQSMTMDEARKMIDIAFKENQINDWRDDNEKYKNADEWLNDVGTDEVAMYVENGYSTLENYLNPLYDRDNSYGEDYTLEDIIEAYKNGTLTGGTKQQANRLDLTKTGNRLDTRFYSPQNIENIQEVYNIANERVNNNNRDDVYKARGQFVILAHNQENIDNLGLDRQELNKKLKNWAAYSNKALELSNRLNANVDRNNQWAGLENSSIINTASISNEELSSLVKSIEGDNSEWQRHYITSTMLALDTHINYKDLSFQFDQNAELSEKNALGDYSRSTKTIRIGRGYQNTVAHEMGHYLDNKWAEDFGFFSTTNMTDNLNFKDANVTEDVKQFAKNFKIFMDDLVKGATSDSTSNVAYYQDRSEVFARFVGKFVEWVKNTASDGRFGYEDKYYKDNFTQNQYEEFVKLLQEKAMLDSTNQTYNAYSLTSNQNIDSKEIAPIGTTTNEIIAPIREDISNLSNQLNNLSNQIQTLQNGAEMTSDNEIAPVNPYRERAIAQREANQRAEEMYKDENYWKSIEESANQVSDLDEKSAKKMSRNIGKELGLKQKQIKDLQNVIQKAFDEGYSLQDIKNELDMQFGHQRVSEKLDHVIEAQKELKNYKIKVSPTIQKDIADYGYWKQQYFGKIRFSNEGTPVDVAYAELSSRNPSMYPSDIINPTDQLLRIAEVADMDRKYTIDYEMDKNTIDEAANYIHDTIQETLYANAMRQQTDLEEQAMQYNERIQDIPVKKRTRQEVRENLQNTMGITAEDLQQGNDIKSMDFQLTTPERVNEKVFGREVGRKINEQTVFFAKHQEAERIRFLNRELKEIADLGIKARSKESALVQQYGEGLLDDVQLAQAVSDKATQEKIKNAARVLRSKYDTYLDQINEELVEMGYDPIPKRKDYMRHFQELTDKFSQAGIPFNRQALNSENLPTDINGLTEFNVPGKNWFASAQRRTGEKTTYDAITGIDGYLQGASNLMYHTETIQRYRALEKLIRDTYGQTHGLDAFGDDLTSEQAMQRIADIQEGKLSNYAAWLKEQGNAIAGKKGALDRGFERALGRRAYTLASELKKQVGSNMTGFNVRSALTNFISSTIAASKTNKMAMVKGTIDTIRNMFNDDGFIDRSDFLTSRLRGDTSISKKTWQKISNAGQILMSGSDWFTSNVITRSKYYEGIQKGMTDAQAMDYANDFAARVMGDRSKGATAEAFNSKTLGFLTQFQLETNNQWQYMIHDTKMEYQENLAKDGGLKAGATILFQVGQLAAYSYLFNEMFEQLTGSRAAFDILDIIKKLFGLDDDDKDKTFEERMKEAGSELVDALPFASLFGSGGRLPIGEMLTPAQTLYDYITGGTNKYGQDITLKDVGKDTLEAIPYYVLPTGYGQIKKTAKGLGMYDSDLPIPGSYTDSGNLRFTADTDTGSVIKNALFGQWSGEEAKKYRESGYKTIRANDIQEMQDLNMNSSEYREYKNDLKEAGTKNADKLNYINSLDIPISQKNIMASNVVDRDVDMSNYTTYEEFDFAYKNPGKYQAMKAIANNYKDYQTYMSGIEEVRDKYSQTKGYSTEQRKQKVVSYVNTLDLTIPQKAMLLRQYYSSYKRYNKEIVNYVASLDIEYQEKVEILQSLKFKVDDEGNVNW